VAERRNGFRRKTAAGGEGNNDLAAGLPRIEGDHVERLLGNLIATAIFTEVNGRRTKERGGWEDTSRERKKEKSYPMRRWKKLNSAGARRLIMLSSKGFGTAQPAQTAGGTQEGLPPCHNNRSRA